MREFLAMVWRKICGQEPAGGCLDCGVMFWSRRNWEEHNIEKHGARRL